MFFAIAGFLSGALLVVLFNENAERANELLKDTINNLEEDIDLLNSKIKWLVLHTKLTDLTKK